MSQTFKTLLIAGVLALFCINYVFDLNDSRVDTAEAFVRGDGRIQAAVGTVKSAYLMPLGKSLKGPRNHMFFYVIGQRGARMVQIASQDAYSGRVQNYCLDKDCYDAGL